MSLTNEPIKDDYTKGKLKNLSEITKNTMLISNYFDDPIAAVEEMCQLSSETARLVAVKKLVERVIETKNDFVKAYFEQEKKIDHLQESIDELFKEREEITKEVNTAKIIVKGLMLQLKEAYSLINKARIQPELVERIMNETKQILRSCPCCKSEKFGKIEETLSEAMCPKCKTPYEISLMYSVEDLK